jgi:hypothetical protein
MMRRANVLTSTTTGLNGHVGEEKRRARHLVSYSRCAVLTDVRKLLSTGNIFGSFIQVLLLGARASSSSRTCEEEIEKSHPVFFFERKQLRSI